MAYEFCDPAEHWWFELGVVDMACGAKEVMAQGGENIQRVVSEGADSFDNAVNKGNDTARIVVPPMAKELGAANFGAGVGTGIALSVGTVATIAAVAAVAADAMWNNGNIRRSLIGF